MEQRNFTIDDVEHILNYGTKTDRHDTGKFGDPTCRIIGEKLNGEWGSVAIALDSNGIIVVLTVMDDNSQRS